MDPIFLVSLPYVIITISPPNTRCFHHCQHHPHQDHVTWRSFGAAPQAGQALCGAHPPVYFNQSIKVQMLPPPSKSFSSGLCYPMQLCFCILWGMHNLCHFSSCLYESSLKSPYAFTTVYIIFIRIMLPDSALLLHPMWCMYSLCLGLLAISMSRQKSICFYYCQLNPHYPCWICYVLQLCSRTLCGTVVRSSPCR